MSSISQAESRGKSGIHYGWFVVISLIAIMIGNMGALSSTMPTFTSSVISGLNVEATQVALYFTIVNITMVIFQPVVQKLFKTIGIRVMASLAVTVGAISMGMMSIYPSIGYWYLAAVINGMCLAVTCYILVPVTLKNWFSVRYGFVVGLVTAFTGIGGAILPPIAGHFISTVGWRQTYVIIAAISWVIAFPLACFVLRDKPEVKGLKPYGWEEAQAEAAKDDKNVVKETWGLTFSEALRTPMFYLAALTGICVFFVSSFLSSLVNFAVSQGFDIALASYVSTCTMLGILIGKPILGTIHDYTNVKITYLVGAACGIAGLILFLYSHVNQNLVFVGAFVFGIMVALMTVGAPLLVRRVFGLKDYSMIYSVVMSCGVVGSASSHLVYNRILDVTGSYYGGLYFALCLCVLAIIFSWTAVGLANKYHRNLPASSR